MRNKGLAAIAVVLTMAIVSCVYDKDELVYPKPVVVTCDTSNVRYAVEITNILSANCYRCHGGAAQDGSGIQLDVYNNLKFMATSGQLVEAIAHGPNASPMPKGAAQLSECNIAIIKKWVSNGAPEN